MGTYGLRPGRGRQSLPPCPSCICRLAALARPGVFLMGVQIWLPPWIPHHKPEPEPSDKNKAADARRKAPRGDSGQNTHKKVGAEKFSTPTFGIQNQLLSFDRASGASALASTAVDAAASVDDSLVSHADRANGAGVNTSAASNALVGNHMSHCETPYLRADCILPPAPCTVGSPAAASKWVVFSPTCSEILYHPGTRFARPKR